MKNKFVSLGLLLPAIVLAQSAPQAPQTPVPPPNAMQNPPMNSSNAVSAPAALKNAKEQAKEIKGKLPSNGDVGSSSNCHFTDCG